jgi:branched-chain amino acid transport system permease protein
MQHIKTGVIFGVLAGLFTFLFGGWSVTMLGIFAGAGLGLALENKLERGTQLAKAKEALPVALVAGGLMVALSLFGNFVVQPATGKFTALNTIVVAANILGFIAMVGLAMLTASFRGLDEKKEKTAKTILLAAIVIAFPFIDVFMNLRWTSNIIFALIFVILGLGLNIVVGYAGLLNLGYAAFFAIGAYTTGILSSPQHDIFLNFWLVIWLAAGMAALWGFLLGAPTLPVRGDYLGIVTLGFGEIIPVIFKNLIDVTINEPLTCWVIPGIQRLFGATNTVACINLVSHMDLTAGEKGINPIGRPILFGYEFQSNNTTPWYFLIILIIMLTVFLIQRMYKSRLGRSWMAIREDELASAQMGIDPVKTKLAAFAIGAVFAGFAGAFYAAYIRAIFPSVFDFSASIIILCVVILGGIGNINGVIVGGLVIMTADRLFLPALKDFLKGLLDFTILPALSSNPGLQAAVSQNANPILYRFLLFGLTLVIMMRVRPEGLIPSAQMRAVLHADEEIEAVQNDESKKAKKG